MKPPVIAITTIDPLEWSGFNAEIRKAVFEALRGGEPDETALGALTDVMAAMNIIRGNTLHGGDLIRQIVDALEAHSSPEPVTVKKKRRRQIAAACYVAARKLRAGQLRELGIRNASSQTEEDVARVYGFDGDNPVEAVRQAVKRARRESRET